MLSNKQNFKEKKINYILNFSLTYGVGNIRLNNFVKNLGVNPRFFNIKTKKKLNIKIEKFFRRFRYTYHLRNKIKKNVDFLWNIRNYKGFRNKFHLPARGQRTKTNARTKKKIKSF